MNKYINTLIIFVESNTYHKETELYPICTRMAGDVKDGFTAAREYQCEGLPCSLCAFDHHEEAVSIINEQIFR